MPLFDHGFVNVTVQKSFSNFTHNGGCDIRVCNGDSSLITNPATLGFPLAVAQAMKDYPRINPIAGAAPQSQVTQAALNAGYDINDSFKVYAFGTYSHRWGKGYENVRMPNKVIARPGTSQPCSATNLAGYATAFDSSGNATCAIGVDSGASNDIGTGGAHVAGPVHSIGVSAFPGEIGNTGLNSRGNPGVPQPLALTVRLAARAWRPTSRSR